MEWCASLFASYCVETSLGMAIFWLILFALMNLLITFSNLDNFLVDGVLLEFLWNMILFLS